MDMLLKKVTILEKEKFAPITEQEARDCSWLLALDAHVSSPVQNKAAGIMCPPCSVNCPHTHM
jgi:hypothetical protein